MNLSTFIHSEKDRHGMRSMKIEPVGFLSIHNVEGPFKLQFHKTREEIYTDTCLRIDAVYTDAQLRQLVEACAQVAGPEDSYQDEWFNAKADAVNKINALIKELLG